MTLPPPEVYQQIFASWVLFGAPDWTEADRIRLFGLLAKHGLSINDLPQTFRAVNVTAAPSRPKDKIYERLWRLFGQLGSDNQTIRTTAREKLDAFLVKQKLSWNRPQHHHQRCGAAAGISHGRTGFQRARIDSVSPRRLHRSNTRAAHGHCAMDARNSCV